MKVTARQQQLVRDTFALVKQHESVAALLFYRRLFTLNPSLRHLFHNDIEIQGRKLMEMLDHVIASLNPSDETLPLLETLGRRHVTYGVRDEHYEIVGSALLWTLEQDLGQSFTPEVKEAWTAVYGFIATTMKNAAREMSGPLPVAHGC